jgi:hypothetical protein
MHAEFSEWYRSANMEPNGDALPKRWAAIDQYDPDCEEIIFLARLFYGLGKPDETLLATFQKAFQEADPLFKTRNNDHELALLAGAELVDVIEFSGPDLADLAALSLVCAAAANLRNLAPAKEIPELAAQYLNKRTLGRTIVNEDDQNIGASDSIFATLSAMEPPLTDLAKEVQKIERNLALVREESNMLWWLFSEYSRDMQKPWKDVPFAAVPVIAGKELSDLTCIIPGPVAARAFLDRVLHCAKSKYPATIALAEAINELPVAWREKCVSEGCPPTIESLLPFTLGIKLSLAAPKDGEWIPALTQGTRIKAHSKLPPSALANQMFLESQLCRAWKRQAK